MKYFVIGLLGLLFISCSTEDEQIMETPLPILSIAEAQVMEGDIDKLVNVTVTMTGQVTSPVSVSFSTTDGTATAGTDFIGVTGQTLSFNAGENVKNIGITIIGDTEVESTENFQVNLEDPVNAKILRSSSTVTIENDDIELVEINADIPEGGYTSPDTYDGLNLVWSDEFNGDKINLDNWTFEIGGDGWGNNELQYYQDKNVTILEDDYLVIEARDESVGSNRYTSSRIITKGKKEIKYGRIDIRAVLPKGQGIWPALWMLGANIDQVSWPACGEIDIMEIIGNEPANLHGTIHWDDNGNYASYGLSTTLPSGDFSDEFHVFSIIWDSGTIKWLLDGVQYNIVDITPPGLFEFQNPFYFVFNIAVGGNWPGSPDESTQFPQHMIVDYIRVFQ